MDAYFAQVRAAFERASQNADSTPERHYQVADRRVSFHPAGSALIPFVTPALAHLAAEPAAAELRVYLYDSASTDTPFVFPSEEVRARFERGEVWSYRDDGHQLVIDPYSKTATLFDAAAAASWFWTPSAQGFSYHETSFPLRLVWRWWLEPKGIYLTHAAAVANARGAVLVAGPGGTGKSTTALACLAAGLGYVGDDFVLTRAEPSPHVYSLYCSAKMHTAQLRHFARLNNRVINPHRNRDDKALLMLGAQFGDALCMDAPLRALFIPRIRGGGATRLTPLAAPMALRQLAVGTFFVTLNANQAEMDTMAQLARTLPCYTLDLGDRFDEIPAVIREYLDRAA